MLTRAENNGYASFKNDTSIIDGIANVFPVFFILIALLVCVTTMTRMVEEERTQIGTLKALGCSDFSITMKYMLYAGSAALLGWAVGFFGGTWGLPKFSGGPTAHFTILGRFPTCSACRWRCSP